MEKIYQLFPPETQADRRRAAPGNVDGSHQSDPLKIRWRWKPEKCIPLVAIVIVLGGFVTIPIWLLLIRW